MQTLQEIRQLLSSYDNTKRNSRWKKYGDAFPESNGLPFDRLKKIAKGIPPNRALAIKLRQQKNYDMKVLSFLIDEPKKILLEETKRTITKANLWPLHRVYISSIFIKLPYAMELAATYRSSTNLLERRYGYSYLPHITKTKKVSDAYFVPIINTIEVKLQLEDNYVKDAMNNALYAIGKRSDTLREFVLSAARNIGRVIVDYGTSNAQTLNVMELLEKLTRKQKLTQNIK